jgi:hypothetical protein
LAAGAKLAELHAAKGGISPSEVSVRANPGPGTPRHSTNTIRRLASRNFFGEQDDFIVGFLHSMRISFGVHASNIVWRSQQGVNVYMARGVTDPKE